MAQDKVERLIVRLLKSIPWQDRRDAAWELGKIRDRRAVEPLINALEDGSSEVRLAAAWALGRIGDRRAIEPLIKALVDEDKFVREEAAKALDRIGWKPANQEEKATYLVAKSKWSKTVKLGKVAVKPLIKVLRNDWIRYDVAWALAKIEDKSIIPLLIEQLEAEHPDSRAGAAYALGYLKAEGAVGALIMALRDEDASVREKAAEALGKIGDSQAVDPLIKALGDREWAFRKA